MGAVSYMFFFSWGRCCGCLASPFRPYCCGSFCCYFLSAIASPQSAITPNRDKHTRTQRLFWPWSFACPQICTLTPCPSGCWLVLTLSLPGQGGREEPFERELEPFQRRTGARAGATRGADGFGVRALLRQGQSVVHSAKSNNRSASASQSSQSVSHPDNAEPFPGRGAVFLALFVDGELRCTMQACFLLDADIRGRRFEADAISTIGTFVDASKCAVKGNYASVFESRGLGDVRGI